MTAMLQDLLVTHERLDELFLSHQEALLEGNLSEARTVLAVYRELLELHMRHEELVLLPRYQRMGPSPAWPVELYSGQHERMRELLSGASERLARIDENGPGKRRQIIALLDFERTFKHLSEHHDLAERRGLFPALAIKLGKHEQGKLVGQCLREWRHLERALLGMSSVPAAE
jgi:hemerythrin-like domain-containing protein